MPNKNESMLMGGDASHDTSTELSFMPAAGPFDADNVVKGTIGAGDEDWIAIELTEGNEYTITVGGGDATADPKELNDSVLKLMDSKGNSVGEENIGKKYDDIDGPDGKLGSEIKFTPEAGSGTQKYYISVSGNTDNPGSTQNTGTYTVTVKAVAVLPEGESADIEGTPNADKIEGSDDSESIAGLAGDDTLIGGEGDDTLIGGPDHDLLVGGAGRDTLKGGAGEDTISYKYSPMGVTINLRAGTASGGDAEGDKLPDDDIENVEGSMYDDTLTGSRVANKIWGLGGNDNLFGDRRDDTLDGGAGDDELDGGDGDDTLIGGPGGDVLTGGEDDDTASYAGSTEGVTVRLHAEGQQPMGGDADGDTWGDMVTVEYDNPDSKAEEKTLKETVPDIVHLTGSGVADILAGDSRANTIKGGDGNDKIYGGPGGGDDTLEGDGGNDMLFGGIGVDTLKGGAGNDTLNGGKGNDTFYGGDGNDKIYADSADTTINGWVESPPDDDSATTDVDESAESTNDSMAVDTVSFEKLKEGIGDGATTRVSLGNDDATGANARIINVENLIGTPEDDWLGGNNEDNVIEGHDGADNMDGGTHGTKGDTVSYRSSDRGVTVSLDSDGTGTASGGHAQGDTVTSFENAIGSAYDDNLTADEGGSSLNGLAGDDELIGSEEADTIEGGADADEMNGGTKSDSPGYDDGKSTDGVDSVSDTLSYASSNAAVTANLATHTYSGGHAEGDEIEVQRDAYDPDGDGDGDPVDVSTFENLTGSMHNDRLTGDHRKNTIMGGDGDDTISGGGEMDTLNGGKGDDSIKGDAGGDHLIGGPDADRLDGGEMRGERDNMVDSATDGRDNDGDDEVDEDDETGMVASEYDWAVYRDAMASVTVDLSENRGTGGEAKGDRLIGIELIWGSKHADTFIAAADEDTFDIIHGDAGSDTVSYEASETGVVVDLGNTVHHTLTPVTGTGTETDPFVFPGLASDTDPAITQIAVGVGGTGDAATNVGTAATNGAFGDRLASIENLTGSNQRDILGGDANPNVLKGMGGNDELDGSTGNDTLYGGAGRDIMDGGVGDDKLNGGAGDDELTGSDGADIFVFAPGHGSDIINDLAIGTGDTLADRIDLSAFDLDPEDLAGMISTRGTGTNARVIINLTSVDGGTIELIGTGVTVEALDEATDDSATTDVDESADGVIQELNVFHATDNPDGVFIL